MTKIGHIDQYGRFVEGESRLISGNGAASGSIRISLGSDDGGRVTVQSVLVPLEDAERPMPETDEGENGGSEGGRREPVQTRLVQTDEGDVHLTPVEPEEEGTEEEVDDAPCETVLMRINRYRIEGVEDVPEITYGVRSPEQSELISVWRRNGEYDRIRRELEAVPESERTNDQVMALADAYCHIGGPDLHVPVVKAVMMLKSLEDDMCTDLDWNILMAECFRRLEWNLSERIHVSMALGNIERAEERGIDMEDRLEDRMRLERRAAETEAGFNDPRFESPFRVRVARAWDALVARLPEVERLMNDFETEGSMDRAAEIVTWTLREAMHTVCVGLSFDADDYVLTLSPMCRIERLHEMAEMVRRAPLDRMPRWTVRVGREPRGDPSAGARGGGVIRPGDVSVLATPYDGGVRLTIHCPKLDDAVRSGETWPVGCMAELAIQVIGEVPTVALVRDIAMSTEDPEGSVPMSSLRSALLDMGFGIEASAESLLYGRRCERPASYRESPYPDVRLEMKAGTTSFPQVIRNLADGRCDIQEPLLLDGASVQTIYFSVPGGSDPSALRREVEEAVDGLRGGDSGRVIGGATGLDCGCVDLIAWDNREIGQMLYDLLDGKGVRFAMYATFTPGSEPVVMIDRTEPELPEGGVLGPGGDDDVICDLIDEGPGAAKRRLDGIISKGLRGGRVTERQVDRDPEVWAFRCMIALVAGDYEGIFSACRGMETFDPPSGRRADWLSLLSHALMLCGRLDEARECAERGLSEDGHCPELWLQAAKLRAHFGDREGALEAARRGAELAPDSVSFRFLPGAIEAGADIASMEYCFPGPDVDWRLLLGNDRNLLGRTFLADGIVTDPDGLRRLREAFHPVEGTWRCGNVPFPEFGVLAGGVEVLVTLWMDLAAASKLDPEWLRKFALLLEAGGLNSPQAVDPGIEDGRRDGVLCMVNVYPTLDVLLLYRRPNGDMFSLTTEMNTSPRGSRMPGVREWFGRCLRAMERTPESFYCHAGPDAVRLGELELPTGRLAIVSPSDGGVREFVQRVPPGRYPVMASVNTDGMALFTEVKITDAAPCRAVNGIVWGQEFGRGGEAMTDPANTIFCLADASRADAVADGIGSAEAPSCGGDALVLEKGEIWKDVAVGFFLDSRDRVCSVTICPKSVIDAINGTGAEGGI